jgi:MOSC domain-containing protein YiiM
MQPVVRSVNVGSRRSGIRRRGGETAIDKRPVAWVEVRDPGSKRGGLGSGVIGDDIGSRKHHGGSHQAVYAVAREELDWWGAELRRELRDGMFGENLTTVGLDVDGAVMGERWRVGSALLEVSGPRIPCATFAAWMGERAWVRRFTERGRTGAYLSVVEPGTVSAGDGVEVLDRPAHGITVPEVFRAFTGDDEGAARVLALGLLAEADHRWLERRLARRRRSGAGGPAVP